MQLILYIRIYYAFLGNLKLATKIGTVSDVSKKSCYEIDGKKIAVFKVNGKFYAINNECTHKGGPLCSGKLDGSVVTCPWHGGKFDVTTGKVMGPPSETDETTHKVTVKGNEVFVELASESKKKIKYSEKLDTKAPFSYKPYLNWLLTKLKFKTKLYGVLDMKMIYQNALETDFDLGEIHITELDLKVLSKIMAEAKKKWKTDITYCLYHSTQFPGHMLLNIRGPKAPMSLNMNIKFSGVN